MNPLIVVPIFDLVNKGLDRWFPNETERQKAEIAFTQMLQEQEFKKIVAQLEINAKEAAHPSIFVAGWRPFVGWIGGFGLLYACVLHNLLVWLAYIYKWPVPPAVDTETLLYILGALLGIGTMRSIEKVKGASK